MHCFTESYKIYERWLEQYPKMKFGVVLNKANVDFLKRVPLKHLLLETDAPYFAPKSVRRRFKMFEPFSYSFFFILGRVQDQRGVCEEKNRQICVTSGHGALCRHGSGQSQGT